MAGRKIHTIIKEAYKLPMGICLFFVPLFFAPFSPMPFSQGKELFFKAVMLIALAGAALSAAAPVGAKAVGTKGAAKKGAETGVFTVRGLWASPLAVILAAAASVAVIADAFSPTPLVALFGTYARGFGLIINLYLLFSAFWCACVLTVKNIRPLLRLAFIAGVITALYAIMQRAGADFFFKGYDTDIFTGRVFGFLGNPGYLGQFMLLIALIGMYLAWTAKGTRAKILYLAGLAAVFIAMAFSGTRTAFFALGVTAVLSAIKYRKEIVSRTKLIGSKKIMIVLLVIAVLGGIFAILPKDRFSLSLNAFRSVESRAEIWRGAFDLFLERPLIGYGEESFYIYFPETITKRFLTLEEEINLTADRVHNEFLEKLFSYGIAGGIVYLVLFSYLLLLFFRSKDGRETVLALVPLANIIQNQFGFSDITISVLSHFCLGAIIALQISKNAPLKFKVDRPARALVVIAALLFTVYAGYQTVYRPVMAQLSHSKSITARAADYAVSVNALKKALDYTPYYGQLWYELIFMDPSSMPRALAVLEMIEGESGSVLAWNGNMYRDSDPQKAADFYLRALEKNPWNPGWSRAFGDMLYKNGDYENALFMYKRFLEAAPDFWKWSGTLMDLSPEEQKSYRVFFKNTPDFLNTVARVQALEIYLSGGYAPPDINP